MFALIANGGPPLVPRSGASAAEWAVWGACVGAAAVLGGWGLLNRNRPARGAAVGVSILAAMVLVACGALFVMSQGHARQMEHNRIERERENNAREPRSPR